MSSSSITTQVLGGSTGSFSITLNPAPTANVNFTLTPPSSVTIQGGNVVLIKPPANSATVTVHFPCFQLCSL